MQKTTPVDIHLEVLHLIITSGTISLVKVREFIGDKYSKRAQTQQNIVNKLRLKGLIEEKKGVDNLRYLILKKGK